MSETETRAALELLAEESLEAFVDRVIRRANHAEAEVEQLRNNREAIYRERNEAHAELSRLRHLLGSHADGHRCTCTMTDPGKPGIEPDTWEQDPWCPTHPDVDQIRPEFDRLRAVVEAVQALADEWVDYEWTGPCAVEVQRVQAHTWEAATKEHARVLASVLASVPSSGEAESGEGDDRDAIIEDLRMRLALRPKREIVPAVAIQLTDEADWERVAALCGGDLRTTQDPSGEYATTITVPGCPDAAGEDDWLVQHPDGSWTVHGEWADVAVVVPAPVPSGGQEDGEGEGLTPDERDWLSDVWDEETTVSVSAFFPVIDRIIAHHLAARPVLSREAVGAKLGEHGIHGFNGHQVRCLNGSCGWLTQSDYLDHLADVVLAAVLVGQEKR